MSSKRETHHSPQHPQNITLEHEDAFSESNIITEAIKKVQKFYNAHDEIKESHGWGHIQAVYNHTAKALQSLEYTISYAMTIEIQLAALLHDVDDKKYFPNVRHGEYSNASALLNDIGITSNTTAATRTTATESEEGQCRRSNISHEQIIQMISWVGCSDNGNSIPKEEII